MRIVPINCVKAGAYLAKTLYTSAGTILLKQGVELTVSLSERIKENGIYSVFIDDGYSHEMIDDIIKPEIRQKAIKTIQDTFSQIEKNNMILDDSTPFKKRMHNLRMAKYIQSLKGICEYIVDDITKSSVLMINLVDIKSIGTYHYQHALNVGLVSLIMGIELNYTKHELYNLFIGAILHDIGKVFIDPTLLESKPPYTDEQEKSLKSHTELGYRYIKSHFTLEAPASIIILQHHERYNGEGYPTGTMGEHIHKNARIVALANVYDDLTSDTPWHFAYSAHEVMELIMGCSGSSFDPKLVDVFIRKINPYPVGSLVRLSDLRVAVVKSDNSNYPLRPVVAIIDLIKKETTGQIIDLLQHNDLVILQIVKNVDEPYEQDIQTLEIIMNTL